MPDSPVRGAEWNMYLGMMTNEPGNDLKKRYFGDKVCLSMSILVDVLA